ncbi:hypothetical protein AX16_005286 [Volvariella volvacea WC 439]|nr:hypothetical protein AX16_005286 [Volvariella volvacea WC 439]
MPSSSSSVDDYPLLLWVTIPPVLLISAYYIRKWYLARRLRLYGIGKGAPGFQTSVRKVRIPPELAERIKRGEHVSPEEIAAATKRIEEQERQTQSANGAASSVESSRKPDPYAHLRDLQERDDRQPVQGDASGRGKSSDNGSGKVDNDWLPESITAPKRRGKAKKK